MGMIYQQVGNICFMIFGYVCRELLSCEVDEAYYCIELLDFLLIKGGDMENNYMCLQVLIVFLCFEIFYVLKLKIC